jgi:uncharacterized protein (DUF2336 family)
MFDDEWPRLGGLFALSEAKGLDVRPTLLRVLTDLFVDSTSRTRDEIRRYAELAAHLIRQVDEDTRIIVAGKLGPCPFAPRPILDSLIAMEPEAAGLVIEASPLLTRDDLWTLATDGGPMTAAAIARRTDLDAELVQFLARKGYPLVADTLSENPLAPIDRKTIEALAPNASEVPGLASRIAGRRGIAADWLGPLFLELGASERAHVVAAYRADGAAHRLTLREAQVAAPPLVLEALEYAALTRNPADLATGLAELLGLDAALAMRLVRDPSGEALALSLVAIGMPPDQSARVMMFANSEAGQSIERMRNLAGLTESMPRHAAMRLVRAFTASSAPSGGRHEAVFSEAGSARAKTARRAEARPAAAQKAHW